MPLTTSNFCNDGSSEKKLEETTKRLFVVRMEGEIVVLSKNESSAIIDTRFYISSKLDHLDFDYTVKPLTHRNQLPGLWDEDCLPYGTDDEKKIGEILDEMQ